MKQPTIKPTVVIPDADALWQRITAAIPTANPASNLTLIDPVAQP